MKTSKITAWSYSRYKDYVTCPFKAKCKHVDKIKEPGNAAMERGSAIHKMAEDYVKSMLTALLPPELKYFEEELKFLKKVRAKCEQDVAFTKDWKSTGWFDRDAWLRVKMDVYVFYADTKSIDIIDHKTGKPKDDYIDQLELYAIAGLLLFPEAVSVRTMIWYIDSGEEVFKVYKRIELAKLIAKWEKKTAPMLQDVRFAPKPGNYCRWCYFRKDNDGPCQY